MHIHQLTVPLLVLLHSAYSNPLPDVGSAPNNGAKTTVAPGGIPPAGSWPKPLPEVLAPGLDSFPNACTDANKGQIVCVSQTQYTFCDSSRPPQWYMGVPPDTYCAGGKFLPLPSIAGLSWSLPADGSTPSSKSTVTPQPTGFLAVIDPPAATSSTTTTAIPQKTGFVAALNALAGLHLST